MKQPYGNSFTSGIGNTPVKKVEGIWCKCENFNPTRSVKDRGLAYTISKIKLKGISRAVISSSGNAALSAAYFCAPVGISLTVYISPHIHPAKYKALKKYSCEIRISKTPVKDCMKYAEQTNSYNLRQSTDPLGVLGFSAISDELIKQVPEADAIFVPVSSATTLVGIARGYMKKGYKHSMHAVQTQKVHPIASLFDKDFTASGKSIADAIVAKVTPRFNETVKIIRESRGSGWVIEDNKIKNAWNTLKANGIVCSFEGAAAYAAVRKAKDKKIIYKNPVVIITGKYYAASI